VLLTSSLWILGFYLAWHIARRGIDAELRIWQSEQRFRDIAEVSSDWFWEADEKLRITYLSDRFTGSTQIARDEIIGRSIRALLEPDRVDEKWLALRKTLGECRPFRRYHHRGVRRPGVVSYWSLSGKPLFDDRQRFIGYRGSGSDITAIVMANSTLKEAKERAEAAEQQARAANSAKSEFLANMSHELRTPLNAIIGFSDMIRSEMFGPCGQPKYTRYASEINSAGRHLLKIIDDILDLSEIEAGHAELHESSLDLSMIVNEALALVRPPLDRSGHTFALAVPSGLPRLYADGVRLKQILVNLLSNAVKFTAHGGRISLAVALRDDGAMEIVIQDTGIGIAAADLETALAPFQQVDGRLNRAYQGTGLGLPLSKKLVELHGGDLTIDSVVGRGTTITIAFDAIRVLREPVEPVSA